MGRRGHMRATAFLVVALALAAPGATASFVDDEGRNCSFVPISDSSEGELDCVFPFTFENRTIEGCIAGTSDLLPYRYAEEGGDGSQSWCAATDEYSNTSSRVWTLWGFCDCQSVSEVPTTVSPSPAPVTSAPGSSPTPEPMQITNEPTDAPSTSTTPTSLAPSAAPVPSVSLSPTVEPTLVDTSFAPSLGPSTTTTTATPTMSPITAPVAETLAPSMSPAGETTLEPTTLDSTNTTMMPTHAPTEAPFGPIRSVSPTIQATPIPTLATHAPSDGPTVYSEPVSEGPDEGQKWEVWMLALLGAAGALLLITGGILLHNFRAKRHELIPPRAVHPSKSRGEKRGLEDWGPSEDDASDEDEGARGFGSWLGGGRGGGRGTSGAGRRGHRRDQIAREGYVQAPLEKRRVFLVALRSGGLACYTSAVKSNEGRMTYCGELWSLAPGQFSDCRRESQQGGSHRFRITTAWDEGLSFGAESAESAQRWVEALLAIAKPQSAGIHGRRRASKDRGASRSPSPRGRSHSHRDGHSHMQSSRGGRDHRQSRSPSKRNRQRSGSRSRRYGSTGQEQEWAALQ